jgi:cyanophycinase
MNVSFTRKALCAFAVLTACVLAAYFVSPQFVGSKSEATSPRLTTMSPGDIERVNALPGVIVLMGGTFIDAIGEEFVRLAGGSNARLVIIPTAYGPTEEEGVAQFYDLWNRWKPVSVEILHTRDRAMANNPDFTSPLRRATGVWLTGGKQGRVMEVYEGTLVHQELHNVVQRGGVLGGNCAGAMALGELMILRGKDPVITRRGFGIVPKLIADSHFLERNRIERLHCLIEEHPDFFGIGIDSRTAVILEKGLLRVIGKSYAVTFVHGEGVRMDSWAPGDEIEFKSLFD